MIIPRLTVFACKRALFYLRPLRSVERNCLHYPLFNRNYSKRGLVARDSSESSEVSTSVAETVKETTKTVSYTAVILGGVGLTAFFFYVIFNELFSSKSPNGVYSRAFERLVEEPKVKDALGEPVKGFGEETRRGRRRNVQPVIYEKDGVQHMRMRFFLKGTRKTATAHLEVKEGEDGKFHYRYLFIQLDDYPRRVIVIEDNRQSKDIPQLENLPILDTIN